MNNLVGFFPAIVILADLSILLAAYKINWSRHTISNRILLSAGLTLMLLGTSGIFIVSAFGIEALLSVYF